MNRLILNLCIILTTSVAAISHINILASLAQSDADITKMIDAAKRITVLINTNPTGSGVIISKDGSTYYVLTAKHVVNRPANESISITTPDLKEHIVKRDGIRLIPNLDLAVLEFYSDKIYSTAKVGDFNQLTQGSTIIIGGFPEPLKRLSSDLIFIPRKGEITYLLPNPSLGGYSIGYDSPTSRRTSGGPLVDRNGCLVGIHGQREEEIGSGIPINLFSKEASSLRINLISCSSSPSNSQSNPTISSNRPITPLPPSNSSTPPSPSSYSPPNPYLNPYLNSYPNPYSNPYSNPYLSALTAEPHSTNFKSSNLPKPPTSSNLQTPPPASPGSSSCPQVSQMALLPSPSIWYGSAQGDGLQYNTKLISFFVWNPRTRQVKPYAATRASQTRNQWIRLLDSPFSVCIDAYGNQFAAYTP